MKTDPAEPRFRWYRMPWIAVWMVVGLTMIGLILPLVTGGGCVMREPARRILCSSHLRSINEAMRAYADEHCGQLPASFGELILSEKIDNAFELICINTGDTPVDLVVVGKTEPRADQLRAAAREIDDPNGHHCSYVYVTAGLALKDVGENDILAFEPADHHNGDGVSVLYGDGHVDWEDARTGTTGEIQYQHLLADHAAGVRPLRFRP